MTQTEAATLLSYLDGQRRHVTGALEGLSDKDLRRPVLPSGWSCLGLVNHLALDVERFWFNAVIAGQTSVIEALPHTGNVWNVERSVAPEDILNRYRISIDAANTVIRETPLDTRPAWWPANKFGSFRLHTAREIMLHVITETACHAGHLDAVRELIDGKQWMVHGEA